MKKSSVTRALLLLLVTAIGKTPVLRHVPETEAVDRLLELITQSL